MAHKDVQDWAEVRRAYEEGAQSVSALCASFGVGTSALYSRAKKEGWSLRRGRVAKRKARLSPVLSEGDLGFSGMIKTARRQIERCLGEGDPDSAAELERLVRMIKALVSTAKLVEQMEKTVHDETPGADRADARKLGESEVSDKLDDDADALRRELARRLEEMVKSGED